KAVTNFKATLPPHQSELAEQAVKDPYRFDFIEMAEGLRERRLESGLLDQIQRFLLELGAGFAFVSRQARLEVGGKEYFIDLLFYHLRLRCYVVIELKAGESKPPMRRSASAGRASRWLRGRFAIIAFAGRPRP
ncbi:MAG: PDDEXK nuclease domain-containing protein, partial [Elusimicrobia bacterium]|nr:PDDEXK nuclease domain-containing protein [Elusimicrobiota bacterium]